MYEARILATFTASHQLRYADGSVEVLHPHDWHVNVVVEADQLDELGLVVDFHLVRQVLADGLASLHGANLNQHAAFDAHNPSAERVAEHIARLVAAGLPPGVRLGSVEVEEEAGCFARYVANG